MYSGHPAKGFPRPSPAGPSAVLLALLLALSPTPALASAGSPSVVDQAVRGDPADAASGPDYILPIPAPAPLGRITRAELLDSGLLTRDFVDPGPRWGAGHRGVDLAAGAGTAVVAPAAGTVSFVGVVVDRPLVVITHADGLRSTLEPVTSDLPTGSQVGAGERIGSLAVEPSTHCAPAQCLHWGVRRGEDYVDPLILLGAVEAVILLPVG
ncbi:M23 family metallopeptidase [Sanguibacter gelidistatuariae]|nr:peptidoglycan DD-metalloendopeptidase family protein [Sanguibacter gelidistatuariae]